MNHDVFISWSGENSVSHQVALLLKDWIEKVLQTASCFVSSQDIEAGDLWLRHLMDALRSSTCGIICLTPDTLASPWVLFEAGALSVKFEDDRSRVIPLLIGSSKGTDIKYPLAALQCKTAAKNDLWDVIRVINNLPNVRSITEAALRESFDLRWPDFQLKLKNITENQSPKPASAKRGIDEKIDELLGLVRSISTQETTKRDEPMFMDPRTSEETASVEAADAFKQLLQVVQRKRPLISHWVKVSATTVLADGILHLFYAPCDVHSHAALSRDATQRFLNETMVGLGYRGLKLHMLNVV